MSVQFSLILIKKYLLADVSPLRNFPNSRSRWAILIELCCFIYSYLFLALMSHGLLCLLFFFFFSVIPIHCCFDVLGTYLALVKSQHFVTRTLISPKNDS